MNFDRVTEIFGVFSALLFKPFLIKIIIFFFILSSLSKDAYITFSHQKFQKYLYHKILLLGLLGSRDLQTIVAPSKYLFFCSIIKKKIFIRGSKQRLIYSSNEKSSTILLCHDSNYVDLNLINVQLCMESRVG